MVAPHPQTFSPTPEQTEHLLALIADPKGRSLTDIAAEAGLSLPALTLWLAQPDIAARLDAMEALAARRVRLVATDALPVVVQALTTILKNHLSSAPSHPGAGAQTPEQAHRRDETARKAAALLARLSRFTPGPTRARATSALPASPNPTQGRLAAIHAPLATHAGDQAPSRPHDVPSSSTPTPEGAEGVGVGGDGGVGGVGGRCATASAPAVAPATQHSLPADPASLALAILSLPPESVDLSDPETAALLHRLATLPDDAPPDEAQRLVTQLLSITSHPRESG